MHLILFIILSFEGFQSTPGFEFLQGTWKVDGKDQYESWNLNPDGTLSGKGYRIVEGEERVFEFLSIISENNQVIYQAKVPNQNEGEAVPFILNTKVPDCYSFENPNHDFPKKIQYFAIDSNHLKVDVTGDEGKGFTLLFTRQ